MKILYALILLPVVGYFVYLGILHYRHRFMRKPRPLVHRMLVAVRRRQAGTVRFLNMSPTEQASHLQELEAQWQALNARWQQVGQFRHGFDSAERGLPSSGDDDWKLFAFYDLPDFAAYGNCIAALESPQFLLLRNYCEIRFIFGNTLTSMNQSISRLF